MPASSASLRLALRSTDIEGFTALSGATSARVLVDALNRYFDSVATAVYQQGGDVDKFLGDGMLAFFQDPVSALRAALHIQRRVDAFNAQQISGRAISFPTRISLVTGLCLVARIGSSDL